MGIAHGLGNAFIPPPKPFFSSDNPYWRDPKILWGWLRPEYRPRLSAKDFLYASTWEITRDDPHGANCVRKARVLTEKLNRPFALRESIAEYLRKQRQEAKLKEKEANAKQAA